MARINAGSTLANQYAPPFVVADNVATGWELQWNASILAFEAYDPDANLIEAGFDEINAVLFQNVTQQVFVAPWAADSQESLIITIDGVKQHQTAYGIDADTESNTTIVTLADTVSNETVEILGLQTTGGATIGLFGPQNIDSNIPGTVDANYTINWFAPSAESLIVTIDGLKQATNNYSIAPAAGSSYTQTTLTFPDRTITFLTDASGINAGNDRITTDTAHGFVPGDGVYYSADGGVASFGLTDGDLYYVHEVSAFVLSLHVLRSDSLTGATPVTLTVPVENETHAMTLISDPYLYVNDQTMTINAGGTGYVAGEVITFDTGTPVVQAQITVVETDVDAQIQFSTDGSGNIAVDSVAAVSGGSGYPANLTGANFSITANSDTGFTPGTAAVVTYNTDANGVITVVSNTAGDGYTINLTNVDVDVDDLPAQTLGAITQFTLTHVGEYIVFPTANTTEYIDVPPGSGAAATFNITRVSPQLEVVGITTSGETPASPVDATNLVEPDSVTTFGLYDSKTVTGDTQILGFKSISAGTNVTLTDATTSITIDADNPAFAETTSGGGTSLFDTGTIDQDAPTFRKLFAGDNIALSVAGADNPIVIAQNFNYLSSADATITLTTERLVNVLAAGATTVNLPAASTVTAGDSITIKDANGSAAANNIAVTPDGTDDIDGVNAAVTLITNRAYITLYSDNSDWHIIGQG